MKKIFGTLYSIYSGTLFFLCLTMMLLLYIPLLLIRNDRSRMRVIYFFNRVFLRYIWSNLTGVWVTIQGREKIKDDQVYAFVCNHSNMLDIPFNASCIDHYYKPLVKKELMSVPVLGPLLRMTSIGVDRKNAESRQRTTKKMIDSMKAGMSLLIFPEGTRNRTPEPTKEFYDGAFKIAIAAQASIAPIVLINIRHLQPVNSLMVFPGRVTMRFLDPISTVGMTESDTEKLKNHVRELISDVLRREDVLFKDKS